MDTNLKKMTDMTNETNITNLKLILEHWHLCTDHHNLVIDAINDPPIHENWQFELNPHHRLFIPVDLTKNTDMAYKKYVDALHNENICSQNVWDQQYNYLTDYQTFRDGKLPDGRRLFKWLSSYMHKDALTEITTIKNNGTNFLVISKNPIDWLFMSTNQSFTSCMSLRSSYSGAYYMGIPEFWVDPHKFLVYLTPGKLRSYNIKGKEFKHFRYINRSISVFTEMQELAFVRYYPNKSFDFKLELAKHGILAINNEDSEWGDWRSHNYPSVPRLKFTNGTHCEPYHDHGGHFDQGLWNNRGSLGSRMSITWDNGFEEFRDIEYCSHLNECDWCNRGMNEDYYIYDGERLCFDCHDEYIRRCESCCDPHHIDDMNYVDSCGEWYCNDCFADDFCRCDRCDEYEHNDEINYLESAAIHLCTYCYDSYVFTCLKCNEAYIHRENNGHDVCNDCNEEIENQIDSLLDEHQDAKDEAECCLNQASKLNDQYLGGAYI